MVLMPAIDMSLDIMSIIIESTSRSFRFTSRRRLPPESERYSSSRSASPGLPHAQHEFTRPTHDRGASRGVAWTGCLRNDPLPLPRAARSPPRPPPCSSTAGGLLVASPASAHDELVSSDPAADSSLDALPAQLTLTFSGELATDPGATELQVTDAAGTSLADGDRVVEGTVVTQPLTGAASGADHRAVEGRLQRRAPDLGRVRVHRHRSPDTDADADRDSDAPRAATPTEAPTAEPTATPTVSPVAGRQRQRRAAMDHRRTAAARRRRRCRDLPPGLARAPRPRRRGAARERRSGRCRRPGIAGPRPVPSPPPTDRLEPCLTTTSPFSAPAPAVMSRPSEQLSSAFPLRSSRRSTGAVCA